MSWAVFSMKSSTNKAVFVAKYLDSAAPVTAIKFSLNFSWECSVFVMENRVILIFWGGESNSGNEQKLELHM